MRWAGKRYKQDRKRKQRLRQKLQKANALSEVDAITQLRSWNRRFREVQRLRAERNAQ